VYRSRTCFLSPPTIQICNFHHRCLSPRLTRPLGPLRDQGCLGGHLRVFVLDPPLTLAIDEAAPASSASLPAEEASSTGATSVGAVLAPECAGEEEQEGRQEQAYHRGPDEAESILA